jgi:uncharacterized protein DUF4383
MRARVPRSSGSIRGAAVSGVIRAMGCAAGHGSGALLLGLFRVSVLHNLVHLAFGIAGVALARTVASSRKYLIGGGSIYALLWLNGMIVPHDAPTNFVPVNWPDNWLHFVLAIGMIALGVTLGRRGENGR